eukprot:1147137-Pelagomonas_calceolata.AAC.1
MRFSVAKTVMDSKFCSRPSSGYLPPREIRIEITIKDTAPKEQNSTTPSTAGLCALVQQGARSLASCC